MGELGGKEIEERKYKIYFSRLVLLFCSVCACRLPYPPVAAEMSSLLREGHEQVKRRKRRETNQLEIGVAPKKTPSLPSFPCSCSKARQAQSRRCTHTHTLGGHRRRNLQPIYSIILIHTHTNRGRDAIRKSQYKIKAP